MCLPVAAAVNLSRLTCFMHFRFQRCLPLHGIDWLRFIYRLSATLRGLWTFNLNLWLVVLRRHAGLHHEGSFAIILNIWFLWRWFFVSRRRKQVLMNGNYCRKIISSHVTTRDGPKISNEEFVIKNDKFRVFAFGTFMLQTSPIFNVTWNLFRGS